MMDLACLCHKQSFFLSHYGRACQNAFTICNSFEEKRREEKFVVRELPLSSLMYGKCQYMLTVVLIWRYI